MAVEFTQRAYITNTSAVVTTTPLTLFGWVNANAPGTDGAIICIERTPAQGFADDNGWFLEYKGSNGTVRNYATGPNPFFNPHWGETPAGSFAFNQWNFVGGVFTSNTSRQAFCNTIAGTVDTGQVATPTVGATRIGARVTSNTDNFRPLRGCAAFVGVYDIALTAGEMLQLAGGADPTTVQSAHLVLLMELTDDATKLVDTQGGPDWIVGTATSGTPGSFGTCLTSPPVPTPIPPTDTVRRWFANPKHVIVPAAATTSSASGYLGSFVGTYLGTYV